MKKYLLIALLALSTHAYAYNADGHESFYCSENNKKEEHYLTLDRECTYLGNNQHSLAKIYDEYLKFRPSLAYHKQLLKMEVRYPSTLPSKSGKYRGKTSGDEWVVNWKGKNQVTIENQSECGSFQSIKIKKQQDDITVTENFSTC